MIEITGDFWSHLDENSEVYDAICCTTNTCIKSNGELVMGAGIAKDFANEYKWLPANWGARLLAWPKKPRRDYIGVFITLMKAKPHLVFLQTKVDWKTPSTEDMVKNSIWELEYITTRLGWQKVLLPRPGCKNGGLSWKDSVRPIALEALDNRFVVINNGT